MKNDHEIAAMFAAALIITMVAMVLLGEFIFCVALLAEGQSFWLTLPAIAVHIFTWAFLYVWLVGD
jgi:hypothetical protein